MPTVWDCPPDDDYLDWMHNRGRYDPVYGDLPGKGYGIPKYESKGTKREE
jgi:hypothetical protein